MGCGTSHAFTLTLQKPWASALSPKHETGGGRIPGLILKGSVYSEITTLSRYAPDLQRDRFYQWLAVWHWLPITLTGIALLGGGAALGGWKLGLSWLLWGVFLRTRRLPCHRAGQLGSPTCGVRAASKPAL